MKNTLMVDIETTGQRPGCKVLSIGAFGFDTKGNQVSFYKRISPIQQELIGLTDDASTLEWWNRQSEEAKQEAFSGTEDPKKVVSAFLDFFGENFNTSYGENFSVWCCGLDFDFPILEALFKHALNANAALPWKFYTQNDYRTIKNQFPIIKKFEGNDLKHSAIEDAKAQMRGLRYFFENIKDKVQ